MADEGEEAASRLKSGSSRPNQHLEEYQHMIELGLDPRVAGKLEEIYSTGKLAHSELEEGGALGELKEFPSDDALSILHQFLESNLENVSNTSAFLCGIMETYRQKLGVLSSAATEASGAAPVLAAVGATVEASLELGKGPDEDLNKGSLEHSTGFTLDVTSGQRKYGGPPPNWTDPPPPNGCQLDGVVMKDGRRLKVNIAVPNLCLFIGNIPKFKGKAELMEEFGKRTGGLVDVIIYSLPENRRKNRGFCFLEYDSHKSASIAKRRLSTGRVRIFGWNIVVDWADRQIEPDAATMSKVKILYVRNLTQELTEERLKESFNVHGPVYRVKKIKGYAFVHFEERNDAITAMEALQGRCIHGTVLEIELAKPPSDRKKKEAILKARQRRLLQQHVVTRSGIDGALTIISRPPDRSGFRAGVASRPGNIRGCDQDFDYERSFGPRRGGYRDPELNGGFSYPGSDLYYGYPTRGGRGRSWVPALRRGGQSSRVGRSEVATGELMVSEPLTGVVPQWSDFGEFPMLPAFVNLSSSATGGPTTTRTGSEDSREEVTCDPVSVGTSDGAAPAASNTASTTASAADCV